MEPRLRASPEQISVLVQFMESLGDLSRPQPGPQGRLRSDRLWTDLTNLLNSVGGGVQKSLVKWKKVWADLKTKIKKKSLTIRQHSEGTGGGPSSKITLTALEERVVAVIGVSAVAGVPGVPEFGIRRPLNEANSGHINPTVTPFAHIEAGVSSTLTSQDFIVLSLSPPRANPSSPRAHLSPPRVILSPPYLSPPLPYLSPPQPHPSPPQVPQSPPRPIPDPSPPETHRSTYRPQASRSPASMATSPRRRSLLRARRSRGVTPFDRAASEFACMEQRRLEFEERRDRRLFELEQRRSEDVRRMLELLNKTINLLAQQRSASLPSTDILSNTD